MESPGIYQISSKSLPERIFVFLAVDIAYSFECHLRLLRGGIHPNKKLQDHFNHFGADDLDHGIIELCSKFVWKSRLESYISKIQPYFNIQDPSKIPDIDFFPLHVSPGKSRLDLPKKGTRKTTKK